MKKKTERLMDARRVDREMVIEDKKVNDLIYIKMITESSYDIPQNQMYIEKKKVHFPEWARDLGYKDTRTFKNGFEYLVTKGVIEESDEFYIMPIATKRYFDVEVETLKKLVDTIKGETLRIYLYLIGWYAWCEKNGRGKFQFSLSSINEALGYADSGRSKERTENRIDILERLGLIEVSDYTVQVGRGYRRELLFASAKLPATEDISFNRRSS